MRSISGRSHDGKEVPAGRRPGGGKSTELREIARRLDGHATLATIDLDASGISAATVSAFDLLYTSGLALLKLIRDDEEQAALFEQLTHAYAAGDKEKQSTLGEVKEALSGLVSFATATEAGAAALGLTPAGDDSAPASGAVYVFARTGGSWSQEAYIKASNTGADDYFGCSVALSGTGDTLAVGALWEDSRATGLGGNQADSSAPDSGAAYVFARTGERWQQEGYIKAFNTDAADLFGASVALSGAGDILAVGGSGEDSRATGIDGNEADSSAEDSGAVYLFY